MSNAAAGSQPHALPTVVNIYRAPPGNFHVGRNGHVPTVFIRHNTETPPDGDAPSLPWFLNPASGRSVHHLITRRGARIDMVHRQDTAFHAGVSAWQDLHGSENGVALLNWYSLGMEFESSASAKGPGDGYTDEQLWTGAHCEACSLISYAGLVVVDHADIALPPGRRVDPSYFPLARYQTFVQAWTVFLRATPPAEATRWFL